MHPEMITRFYTIAGLRICVETPVGEWDAGEGILQGFCGEGPHWDYRMNCGLRETLSAPVGTCVFHEVQCQVFREEDRTVTYLGRVDENLDHADTRISRQGDQIHVEFLRRTPQTRIHPRMVAGAMDLPHLLTAHDGFLLHASFVEYHGHAILFTAPSETGKSTQAQLWCDHAGAALVNGDRAAVRVMDDKVYACGIPFSGSSPVRRNVTLPLAAIVCLSQAPENTIHPLRGVRAFRRVWEGCTLNVWDRTDMERAAKTVSDVVTGVPVYHLACTPDVRAVELLKQTLEVDS